MASKKPSQSVPNPKTKPAPDDAVRQDAPRQSERPLRNPAPKIKPIYTDWAMI